MSVVRPRLPIITSIANFKYLISNDKKVPTPIQDIIFSFFYLHNRDTTEDRTMAASSLNVTNNLIKMLLGSSVSM